MSTLIYQKMADVMRDIGAITKDQKNQAQGFKFRGIDQFINALYPVLVKHRVFMTPKCRAYTQELREKARKDGSVGVDKHVSINMEYVFYAEDGSSVVVGPVPAEGLDSGDKATNKALSGSLKYALIQTFCVPTEDMVDQDAESPVIERKQHSAPTAATPVQTTPAEFSIAKVTDVVSGESQVTTSPNATKRRPFSKPVKTETAPTLNDGGW